MTTEREQEGDPAVLLTFADLPEEVLALTVALGLTKPRDAASFAAVDKRCAAVCKAAPLRLVMPVRAAFTAQDDKACVRAALQALCYSWPGTAELDLQGSPVEDQDVQAALESCASLSVLWLSGCKKLSPALTANLAQRRGMLLRTITLQRCFQLTAAALTDLLTAAGRPGSKLACAALSHLAMGDWPEQLVPPAPPLRMLALHNCAKLSGTVLRAIASACPNLEVLMLGGSAFALEEPVACSDVGTAEKDGTAASAGLYQPAAACALAREFQQQAEAAASDALPALGAGFSNYVAAAAVPLALLICQLPKLRVLELTFGLPGLVPTLQRLTRAQPVLAGRAEPLQVWDLCSGASVAQALQWRRDTRVRHHAAGGRSKGGGITPTDADAFLSAAVNCSSGGRQSPLHAAAEDANPIQLQALLGLGARVDARDRSGASPLFAACEAGHVRSVECLLAAGASATLRNSAGEAPLYIAALKGHDRVVDLLLQHFREQGIDWDAQRLYDGDGWTPLMAAAVGGRTAIALKLLEAAGPAAAQLVQAANRYGQTAIHIAARKGSAGLLRSLVDAGGAASLLTADCDGKTAAEVAKRNSNGSAMRVLADASSMLRREQQRQRGMVPTAERPRTHDRQQQGGPRWVGRRLQQRKGAGGGQSAH